MKHQPKAQPEEAAFAASNSALFVGSVFYEFWIATGGKGGSRVIERINHDFDSFGFDSFPSKIITRESKTEASGIFSLDFRHNPKSSTYYTDYLIGVAVGGDYKNPDNSSNVASTTADGGKRWTDSLKQPHGYRSSVAYFPDAQSWITVGPNGTDVSTDDGRNWRALTPAATGTPDEDKSWNALSLPFVVGPKGRIGILRPDTLGKPQRSRFLDKDRP